MDLIYLWQNKPILVFVCFPVENTISNHIQWCINHHACQCLMANTVALSVCHIAIQFYTFNGELSTFLIAIKKNSVKNLTNFTLFIAFTRSATRLNLSTGFDGTCFKFYAIHSARQIWFVSCCAAAVTFILNCHLNRLFLLCNFQQFCFISFIVYCYFISVC